MVDKPDQAAQALRSSSPTRFKILPMMPAQQLQQQAPAQPPAPAATAMPPGHCSLRERLLTLNPLSLGPLCDCSPNESRTWVPPTMLEGSAWLLLMQPIQQSVLSGTLHGLCCGLCMHSVVDCSTALMEQIQAWEETFLGGSKHWGQRARFKGPSKFGRSSTF